MKRNFLQLAAALSLILVQTSVHAATGNLFNVSTTNASELFNITLCLNASAQLSCQNYDVTGLTLKILTTPVHAYQNAGIRVNSSGFSIKSGCTTYQWFLCVCSQ